MKNTFEGIGGRDGSHCGLTDWYGEHEAALAKALTGKKDFDTGWYSSKKEIASARITRCNGKVIVEVSVSDDFDTVGRGEREVTSPVTLDSIREAIDKAWEDAEDDQKESTNGTVNTVLAQLKTLKEWAEGDAEHSKENGATEQAEKDKARAKRLSKAIFLLQDCFRDC